ncbi:MAG: ribbon-helix-helix domain-containing protein, partial [Rhodopila sp.]
TLPQPASRAPKPTGREGKVHLGAYLHEDYKRSLLLVRAQTGKDVQTLIAQALNDLFRAHNVPVIDHD